MAVVYEGYDPDLHRRVAIKLLRPTRRDGATSPLKRQRLLREAQAMARLNHPNVITIYEVGLLDDQIVLAMEYVQGLNLRDWLGQRSRSRIEVLEVFVQAGRGLRAAHDAGLVHRDFKPENVLVGEDGRVRVLDLGLARAVELGNEDAAPTGELPTTAEFVSTPLTREGGVVGTPLYMAPEQHMGLPVDARADQFAFCVSLFEALTGDVPFGKGNYETLVANVLHGRLREPTDGSLPRWLGRIVLRGLAVAPEQRFSGMGDLLAEIESARAYDEARTGLARSELEGARGAYLRGSRVEARAKLRTAIETTDSAVARGLWWTLRSDPLVWSRDFGVRHYDVAFHPDQPTVATACEDGCVYLIDYRNLSVRILRGRSESAASLAFDPTGRYLACGDYAGGVRIWNLHSGSARYVKVAKTIIMRVTFSMDGLWLFAAARSGEIRRLDASTGDDAGLIGQLKPGVFTVALDPTGVFLAAVTPQGRLTLFDTICREPRIEVERSPESAPRRMVRFSPDGRRIVTSDGGARRVIVWDWDGTQLEESTQLVGHTDIVSDAVFTKGGAELLTCSYDGSFRSWSLESGSPSRVISTGDRQLYALAIAPHDRLAATVLGDVRLWDLRARSVAKEDAGHSAGIVGLAFSPDGCSIATGAYDSTIRIWEAKTGGQLRVLRGHDDVVTGVGFDPHRPALYSCGFDKTVRRWSLEQGKGIETGRYFGAEASIVDLVVSRDGERVYCTTWAGEICWWDAQAGNRLGGLRLPKTAPGLALHPSGRWLAVSGHDPFVELHDVVSGEKQEVPGVQQAMVIGLAWRPDGGEIAWAGEGKLERWNPTTGERHDALVPGVLFGRAGFDPEGHHLVAGGSDGLVRIWSLENGNIRELHGHRGQVKAACFSPDGSIVATAGADGSLRLFDAGSGRAMWRGIGCLESEGIFVTHRGLVPIGESGSRSPDRKWQRALVERGKRAVEGGEYLWIHTIDGQLELWNLERDERLRTTSCPEVGRLVGTTRGCILLSHGTLTSVGLNGRTWSMEDVRAIAADEADVWVATEKHVFRLDPDGLELARYACDAGVTAMARVGDRIAVGFADGAVEFLGAGAPGGRAALLLEGAPASPVTCLTAGPMATVFAGYSIGVIGWWATDDGKAIYRSKLHGPIVELRRRGPVLCAMSELGDTHTMDLSLFDWSYEEVLREVWSEVPVVWVDGMAVIRSAPEFERPGGAGDPMPAVSPRVE